MGWTALEIRIKKWNWYNSGYVYWKLMTWLRLFSFKAFRETVSNSASLHVLARPRCPIMPSTGCILETIQEDARCWKKAYWTSPCALQVPVQIHLLCRQMKWCHKSNSVMWLKNSHIRAITMLQNGDNKIFRYLTRWRPDLQMFSIYELSSGSVQ